MTFTATDNPIAGTHTWLTPKWIIDELGPFDMDPCAAPEPRPFATATKMISEAESDGLATNWEGRVWLNPPYGEHAQLWLEKLRQHGNGIALIFGRTDTAWLQEILTTSGVFFIKSRIRFLLPDGTPAKNSAGAPSVLLPFGRYNIGRVLTSRIEGIWKQ